jgi:uncharacterized membrane protein
VRYGLPLVAAAICLIVGSMVSSQIVAFVLLFAAFGFVLDAATKLFENAGKTGGLGDHRQ